MGGLQLLKEIIEKNNAKVRVLIPANRDNKRICDILSQNKEKRTKN